MYPKRVSYRKADESRLSYNIIPTPYPCTFNLLNYTDVSLDLQCAIEVLIKAFVQVLPGFAQHLNLPATPLRYASPRT